TLTVTVRNVAPAVTTVAGQAANEGEATAFDLGAFSDPGSQDAPWQVEVRWGDGAPVETFEAAQPGLLRSRSHTHPANGTYAARVKATDKHGASDEKVFVVTVLNVAPSAEIDGLPATSPEGTLIALTSAVTDPSPADTAAGFTYQWTVTKDGSAYASG